MPHDRYDVQGLESLLSEIQHRTRFDQRELGQLIEAVEIVDLSTPARADYVQRAAALHLHLSDSSSGNVGRVLADIDRELRRTASFMTERSLRPTKSVGVVELLDARQTSSIDLVIAASKEMYHLLTSQPLSFVMTLSWFWEHRLNRTRSRRMQQGSDQFVILDNLIIAGAAAVTLGHTVYVCLVIDGEGVTRVWLLNDLSRLGLA